jgi:arabinofuranosyltransferase
MRHEAEQDIVRNMKKSPAKHRPQPGAKPRRDSAVGMLILLGIALLLLIAGWRLFWFLTDDAYISFRYVSNSLMGYGYVWNFPPFRPVEGYTNFLWVLLLDGVWRVLRIAPPESANVLALIFSYMTLVLLSVMTLRMKWRAELRPYRLAFVGLLLLFLLTNRTFLAWTSSGLETAMFTFFVIVWFFAALRMQGSFAGIAFLTTLAASLMELTRPDGLLYAAGTIALLAYLLIKNGHTLHKAQCLAAAPLLLIPLHLLWRIKTYGLWLPNSYYAKQVSWWPESGLRYALSFLLEYALWLWIALAVFVAIRKSARAAIKREFSFVQAVVLVTLLFHFLYYTIVVGGDHFEYRVYNHLLVLIPYSFLWLLNRSGMRPSRAIAAMLLLIALSLPVPWTHWRYSHNINTREETRMLKVAVAPHWPSFVRWYASLFDNAQFWLIDHSICMRHQEHKICREFLIRYYPTREEGLRMPLEGYPVHIASAVGVASWALPHANIIDLLGLNDYVIARLPAPPGETRQMAHERRAPKDYVFCFYPNVFVDNGALIIKDRKVPLTPEQIITCEREWRKYVDTARKSGKWIPNSLERIDRWMQQSPVSQEKPE